MSSIILWDGRPVVYPDDLGGNIAASKCGYGNARDCCYGWQGQHIFDEYNTKSQPEDMY